MSSKLGLVLSMLFVAMFFMFGGDLLGLQIAYSDLDSKGIAISYLIAQSKRIDTDFLNQLSERYNVTIIYKGEESVSFGEDIFYRIEKSYQPMIISKTPITLTVNRSTVIGYYG